MSGFECQDFYTSNETEATIISLFASSAEHSEKKKKKYTYYMHKFRNRE